MATWLKVIMLIVQYGPAIWKIVKEIIDLINSMSLFVDDPQLFKQQSKERLGDCVSYYRITRDKSKLEELHGELSVQLSNSKI
jgi:hypothetical protein